MSTLVARHALSAANIASMRESLAFGNGEAPIVPRGKIQARDFGTTLHVVHGIDVAETTVAVSELRRSQETAYEAGFRKMIVYPALNEVIHNMNEREWRAMIAAGGLPEAATDRAKAILRDPPEEPVWISHGAIIAGLFIVRGLTHYGRLIPDFCEIRELPLATFDPSEVDNHASTRDTVIDF